MSSASSRKAGAIIAVGPLGGPFKTPDPFLFAVHHNDKYPAGDSKMQAPRRGNGADFDPSNEYKMYHGDKIPGFPRHPHRGFETITATLTGVIDHSDSFGNAGRYGQGDLQWMTAGSGVIHGENFPLVNDKAPNPLEFFQIWLNLPAADKMAAPSFKMHWAEDVPKVKDGLAEITVWAGRGFGADALSPPPRSWASRGDESDVAVLLIDLQPGADWTLPAARGGKATNRALYFFDGHHVVADGRRIDSKAHVDVHGDVPVRLQVDKAAPSPSKLLLLQGKPIGEPVVQHGPFVMNTREEIQQTFADYRRTQFGGWPWDEDAVVFPRSKGRFSLLDGVETTPPPLGGGGQAEHKGEL